MKNIVLVAGFIILILLGISAFVMLSPSSDTKTMVEEASMQKNESMRLDNEKPQTEDTMMEEESTMQSDARYVTYSTDALDNAANTRRVLFFYANWCPTCRPVDENLQTSQATLPEDVTVIRVNYNDTDTDQEEKDLAKQYGVTYQHTFVQIDSQGNEVTKWNGGDVTQLLENIQ